MYEYCSSFSFHGELNDFLPSAQGNQNNYYRFNGKPSVKDAIEAQGVPHTEIEAIFANGVSVDFSYHLADGDDISVYPVSYQNISDNKVKLRPDPELKFLLDVHLGKLARFMRLAGFDCLYRNDYDDHEIAEKASALNRIVLTRDRKLLRFGSIIHGYWVRSVDPWNQLREVIDRFGLHELMDPFKRCLECNGSIRPVPKESVLEYLEPKTILYYDEFYQCGNCKQVYWKGSHYDHLKGVIEDIQF